MLTAGIVSKTFMEQCTDIMTEIRFYHLQTQTLEQALPKLLMKAYGTGKKIVVRAADATQVEALNMHLWTFHPNMFLPHGSKKDGYGDQQPIWLTDKDDNPNDAKILILTAPSEETDLTTFDLCCDIFNGFDEEQVKAARMRWKAHKEQGFDLTYWQQDDKGGWAQKA